MPCKIELLSCRSVGEGCQPEEASAGSEQILSVIRFQNASNTVRPRDWCYCMLQLCQVARSLQLLC